MPRFALSWLLGVLGAVLGGLAGYFGFLYVYDYGFYAGALAGGMVGVGCGLFSRHHSVLRGILCGVAGIFLGYFCDYRITIGYPNFADYLVAFSRHGPVTNVLVFLGGLVAYWFGQSNWAEPRRGSERGKVQEPDPEFK